MIKFIGFFTPVFISSLMGVGLCALLVWVKIEILEQELRNLLLYLWIPCAIFFFFLIIRLGFIKGLLLPPYSDSPTHYSIVKMFLLPNRDDLYLRERIMRQYYHLGFHGITAWVSVVANNFDPLILALVGQFFLAILPVTVYLWISSTTDSLLASIVSSILAGFGWNMPAYAANWGKYPALVGIALLPVFLGIIHIAFREKKVKLNAVIILFVIGLVWIHSRLIVLLLFLVGIYVLSYFIESIPFGIEILLAVCLSSLILILRPLFSPWNINEYFRYYVGAFGGATYFILLLILFAFYQYPMKSMKMYLWGTLVAFGTFIPMPSVMHKYSLFILDRAFFEISFFLALAALGGLGAKGLRDIIGGKSSGIIIAVILLLLLYANAGLFFSFSPEARTNYVTDDDLFAISWAGDKLPAEAEFIISGERNLGHWINTDSGSWIKILSSRETYNLNYDFDWASEKKIHNLCDDLERMIPHYIYIGSTPKRFKINNYDVYPRLELMLYLPDSQIYQLHCE